MFVVVDSGSEICFPRKPCASVRPPEIDIFAGISGETFVKARETKKFKIGSCSSSELTRKHR